MTERKPSILDMKEEAWEKKPLNTPMAPAGTDLDKPTGRRTSMVPKPVVGDDRREEFERQAEMEKKSKELADAKEKVTVGSSSA